MTSRRFMNHLLVSVSGYFNTSFFGGFFFNIKSRNYWLKLRYTSKHDIIFVSAPLKIIICLSIMLQTELRFPFLPTCKLSGCPSEVFAH